MTPPVKRERSAPTVEERLRVVADATAARADEPRTPWDLAFDRALAEVTSELGRNVVTVRGPLFHSVGDLFRRDDPAPPWLVNGLITRGGIAMLGAEPKVGKTWVATEIAVAVASGTPAFGEFAVTRGVVAYFYAEDLGRAVCNRIRALLEPRMLTGDSLEGRFFACPRGQFLDITRDEDLARIVASCRELGKLDLLILDPLRDISSAAEDKSDEMGPLMKRLRLLGEILGCTVMVTHHAGKSNADSAKRSPGQRMRGSSAIHGSTDSGIYLARRGGDGSNRFEIDLDSEVKSARSAGRREITLAVTDDDHSGEAVSATWSVADEAASKAKAPKGSADDERVLAFVRELAQRGQRLSRRALRDHDERPVPEKRFRASLDRLIDDGRLGLDGAAVALPALAPGGER